MTGTDEVSIRLALSKAICGLMERCLSARRAANIEVQNASKRLMGNAGVIAIKGKGRIASVHNIPLMPWAYSTAKMKKPQTKPQGKIVALLSSSLSR